MIRVVVVGPGRMGRRVLARLAACADMQAVAVIARGPVSGIDVPVASSLTQVSADVVIDFSAPPACRELLAQAAQRDCPYVLGSTGLAQEHEAAVSAAGRSIAVVKAANFSVGVSVLSELAELAARRLGRGFDVEIAEMHHRAKRDAPSGTALSLGRAVQAGRGELEAIVGRQAASVARLPNEMGYAVLRGGDVSGEHTVFFLGDGERVELTHRVTAPDIFADGALRAARWVVRQPAGVYGMRDVLQAA